MHASLIVGARRSPLSRAQLLEVKQELLQYHPNIKFQELLVDTIGDKDLITSLRTLDKTDFFTREIDSMLLSSNCRIAIHSAKDLPATIPKGLKVIAITKGIDPSDSLVMRQEDIFEKLPAGSIIATSSERREAIVRQLRTDLTFQDIRGTIEQRLDKLNNKTIDGLVVAEAALIRLKLTQLNRIKLPGETVAHQGQLAIMARENDWEMVDLFACLDSRHL